MTNKATNYKLLSAGILAFFVIMTYDHNQLMAAEPAQIFKAVVGGLAVIYLVWYNVKRYRSEKLHKSGEVNTSPQEGGVHPNQFFLFADVVTHHGIGTFISNFS